MSGLYTGEAEWKAQHDNVVAWGRTWATLCLIFFAIAMYLLFFTKASLLLIFGFIACQWVFAIAQAVCAKRHVRMHEEIES